MARGPACGLACGLSGTEPSPGPRSLGHLLAKQQQAAESSEGEAGTLELEEWAYSAPAPAPPAPHSPFPESKGLASPRIALGSQVGPS